MNGDANAPRVRLAQPSGLMRLDSEMDDHISLLTRDDQRSASVPGSSPGRGNEHRWCLWCSGFCTSGCEPEGSGSTPLRYPWKKAKREAKGQREKRGNASLLARSNLEPLT
jgi:hypothetical protein